MSVAIQVRNVAKMYRVYPSPAARLKEILTLNRRCYHQQFWALDGISFDVERGGALGVIGPNGSGKSTLLEIVTGTLEPTRGRVRTRGRIAALLSLGAGFNPEFTGRENVYLNGEILGLSRAEVDRAFPEIERFAEIGEFLDQPVKTYSTGMYLRLAFAAAIHVAPEILVVDEVLAVGDAIFVNRCIRKFEELRRHGVTVLLVTHDVSLVKLLCDRALLLYRGQILAHGDPSDVVNRYNGLVLERQKAFELQNPPQGGDVQRSGSACARDSIRRRGEGPRPGPLPGAASPSRGGDHVPHPDRDGSLRDKHGAGGDLSGSGRSGRVAGSEFPLRLPSDAAGVHPDGRHAVGRRHEPRLVGRHSFLSGHCPAPSRRRGRSAGPHHVP